MKQILTIGLSAIFVSSCASTRSQKFENALKDGHCDTALENIPENDKSVKFIGKVQRASGTVLSYFVTGAGYTADVVLTVGTGVLVGAAICAPFIALAAASHSSGHFPNCFPGEAFHLVKTDIGKSTYKNTEEMRCPDLTALARSVRKVARCHSEQETPEGTKNAVTTLSSLKANGQLMECISSEERNKVFADLTLYEGRMSAK